MKCICFFLRWCNILTLNKAPKEKIQSVRYLVAFLLLLNFFFLKSEMQYDNVYSGFLFKYFSLDIPGGEIDWLISQRITALSLIKPVISSKRAGEVTFQWSAQRRCLTCLPPLLSSGVPSPQTMIRNTRLCACFVGPCCVLRLSAAWPRWMGKMWGLATPTLQVVVLGWECSSGQ